jgi:hypothetical protein
MTPTKDESSQGKASSCPTGEPTPAATEEADEPTPTTVVWLCPDVLNTIEQARTLFLYKPPDAKHGYYECIKTPCGSALCIHSIVLQHYASEPPAIALRNFLPLFHLTGVRSSMIPKFIKSKTVVDLVQPLLSKLRLPICRHLRVCDLLVGETLALPNGLMGKNPCQCRKDYPIQGPWPGRVRHWFPCPTYTVCQACHAEGSFTAVGLGATKGKEDDSAPMGFVLDILRDLGSATDEQEPGWKCHAVSSSTLADAQEDWARMNQFPEDECPQKIPHVDSPSTVQGLLDTVWNFLGT